MTTDSTLKQPPTYTTALPGEGLADIVNKGYAAAGDGVKKSLNPYSPIDDWAHQAWNEGWMEFNNEFSNN